MPLKSFAWLALLLAKATGQNAEFPLMRFVKSAGNSGSILRSLSFSPDGSRVASGDNDGNLSVWAVTGDSSTWKLLKTVGNSGNHIWCVKFSPDGAMVASGDESGRLDLWAVRGHPSSWQLLKSLRNAGSDVNGLDFSPDGLRVATGDNAGNLTLWSVAGDPSAWGLIKTLGNIGSNIYSVAFSPEGSLVASGDEAGLGLWAVSGDPSGWHFLRLLGNSSSAVWSVKFSPDGSLVVSGAGDKGSTGTLALWEVGGEPSAQPLKRGASPGCILSVAFSSDGSHVVSADFNANLALWEVGAGASWQPRESMKASGSPLGSVDFSKSGSKVVSGNYAGDVDVWVVGGDPSTWELLQALDNNGTLMWSVDFSPDGLKAVSGDDAGNLAMWAVGGEPGSWQLIKTVGNSGSFIHTAKLSPSGTMVASGDLKGNLKLWAVDGSPSSWHLIRTFQTSGAQLVSLSFSPDGSRVVSGDNSGNLDLWAVGGNSSTWRLIARLANLQSSVNAVSFTPDGSKVVAGDQNGNLNLWAVSGDPATWSLLKTLRNVGSNVNSLSLSPDGSKLASGDDVGNLVLWAVSGEPSTWGPLQTVGNSGSNIYSVSFSPDGSQVASGDHRGNLALWAVAGGSSTWQFLRLVGNSGSKVNSVTFSPDGRRLASGDDTGHLALWGVSARNASAWKASPLFDFLMAVNQYPTSFEEFTRMTACSVELYNAEPHEVCNVTVNQSSSTYLSRSTLQAVAELFLHYLPVMRANFSNADLSSLTAQDLPIPWRVISLWLQNTGFPSSALDLFNFLNQNSPFVQELDISNTLVAGPLADKPRFLKVFRARNTFITNVSATFFRSTMELLDLRNTSFMEGTDAGALNGFAFRHGVPSCGDAQEGYRLDGLLCQICESSFWFDGRPSSHRCLRCISGSAVAELQVAGAALAALVAGLGLLAYKYRARLQALREQADFKLLRQGTKKGQLMFFAYQQMSQLGHLVNPLPPKTETLASATDLCNLHWLSNAAFASCTLGLGYHAAWLLSILEVALLLAAAVPVGRLFKVPWQESLTFAHSLTIMTVATKTLPLFDCDKRLVQTHLPLMEEFRTPRLKVDYEIDCSHPQHQVFVVLGLVVLGAHCILIPLLQTFWLFRVRSSINPPLPRDEYFKAQEEVRRFSESFGSPLESLDQVRLAELGAVRVRRRGSNSPKREVEMVTAYVPSKWWWFPVPTLSRVLLACVYVCPSQYQAFLGCALCMTVALGLLHFRPHVRQTDNEHAMLCQGAVALAFALSSVQPSTPWWLTVVTWGLFAVPALSFLYHNLSSLKPAYKSRRLLEDFAASSEPLLLELCEADAPQADQGRARSSSTWAP